MDTDDLTKNIQKIELSMLDELSKILDKHEIRYFLAFGTALGCIRHRGFIPWDDDVDLYLWGEDYPKLKKVFETEKIENLELHDFSTQKGYPYVFPKIVNKKTILVENSLKHLDYKCGVYIDIFPLFGIPNNKLLKGLFESIRYFRYCVIRAYYSYDDNRITKKILGFIASRFF